MTSYPTPWEKAGKTLTAIRQLGRIRNCLRLNCRSVCLTGEQNPACHSDFLSPSNPYRPLGLQSSVLSGEFLACVLEINLRSSAHSRFLAQPPGPLNF